MFTLANTLLVWHAHHFRVPEKCISRPDQFAHIVDGGNTERAIAVTPEARGKHVLVASAVSYEIGGLYCQGNGASGDWWILPAPEVHFVLDEQVGVPDIAGWRKSGCR